MIARGWLPRFSGDRWHYKHKNILITLPLDDSDYWHKTANSERPISQPADFELLKCTVAETVFPFMTRKSQIPPETRVLI